MAIKPAAQRGDRIVPTTELKELLGVTTRSATAGGIPVYVLTALQSAIREALRSLPDPLDEANPHHGWEPTPEQVWSPRMKRADGKRLSAWERFQAGFGAVPFKQRPFAHEVRQHPRTKQLYDQLCVVVSRNKAKKNGGPTSIGQLFPIADDAKGGSATAKARRRNA